MADRRQEYFQRIGNVASELEAVRAGIRFAAAELRRDPTRIDEIEVNLAALESCRHNLENTYLVRLFSEFEGCLVEFWILGLGRKKRSNVTQYINSVGSRCRMQQAAIDGAHHVRQARNRIVHQVELEPIVGAIAGFEEAKRLLCKFLSQLPRR